MCRSKGYNYDTSLHYREDKKGKKAKKEKEFEKNGIKRGRPRLKKLLKGGVSTTTSLD
jgi:hypothetical protein